MWEHARFIGQTDYLENIFVNLKRFFRCLKSRNSLVLSLLIIIFYSFLRFDLFVS